MWVSLASTRRVAAQVRIRTIVLIHRLRNLSNLFSYLYFPLCLPPRHNMTRPKQKPGLSFSQALDATRRVAEAIGIHSSKKMRDVVTKRFKEIFPGKTPYEWQLDVTEALVLGLDSIVIAGTGAGKTMPLLCLC